MIATGNNTPAAIDQQAAKNGSHQVLEVQMDQLKKQLLEARAENALLKQRLEKLGLIVLDREKKIHELQHYENSVRKSIEKKEGGASQEDKLKDQLRGLQGEKERLCKELEDSLQHAAQLDRVIRFLRERQEEAQLETSQLREEFHKAQMRVAEYAEQIKGKDTLREDFDKTLQQERLAKEEAIEEVRVLYSQFEILKGMLAEAKGALECAQSERSEKELELEELKVLMQKNCQDYEEAIGQKDESLSRVQKELDEAHERFQEMIEESERHQEEMGLAQGAYSELESRLKMAQQHLAKKVKETSDLHDKLHAQDALVQESQSAVEQLNVRFSEQLSNFEAQIAQEKRWHEQLLESSKSSEALVKKWEEKYFHIYEKWQDNEMRLKELKKIEEKHAHLQAILANIGGFFGTPVNYSPADEPAVKCTHAPESAPRSFASSSTEVLAQEVAVLEPETQLIESVHLEQETRKIENTNLKKPYQDLFNIPIQNKHYS